MCLISADATQLLEGSRNSSVALFAAISQISTWYLCASGRCMGVYPVETGLTGPVATALVTYN